MTTDSSQDPPPVDRGNARLAAIDLAVWLAITLAVVGLLVLFGDAISGLFV